MKRQLLGKRHLLTLVAFGILTGAILLLAACARATPTPPLKPTAPPVSDGQTLYNQKCASCHGPQGEGTALAPAVSGHGVSATKMQVRNPMGTMPAFTSAMLSEPDLNKIAEYIISLGPVKSPLLEWEKSTTETIHLWMSLLAIKGDDAQDALHHLEQAQTFIKAPVHAKEIKEAIDLIKQDKAHDAEHEIEEMAGAEAPSGITMKRFHLLLVQRDLAAENAASVKHHLEKFIAIATEKEKEIAREALELVEKGDFHEAEHEVEELLKF